jgi:hypothetical protein
MTDWWTRDRLLAEGYEPEFVAWALARAEHTGHGGEPVLTADQVRVLFAAWERGDQG